MLAYLAATNAMLAIFNLIPAAPLDGGRVLRAALWRWRGNRQTAAVNAARVGRFFGFALIALGVLQVVTGSGLNGIWLALIGWFVVSAATAGGAAGQAALGLPVSQWVRSWQHGRPFSTATSLWPTLWPDSR